MRAVTPQDFKQDDAIGEPMGEHSMSAGLSFEEFTQKQDKLHALYDRLLPVFFANCAIKETQLRASAKEFKQLFQLISEPPLWPYYRAVGANFFDWINQNEK